MFLTTNRLVAGLFLLLLAGAAYFSLERILFADASFILFRLINLNSLQIQEHRYGSFITQGIPLLATRLHLPLKAIVVLYSVSFNLFYLAVAVLLLYRYRQPLLGVLMSFYYLLFVSDTYFWVNNEIHQGIAWMFLFFASVLVLGKRKAHWLITTAVFISLAFLALYTHPLVLFPTGFFWLFFVTKNDWPFSHRQTVFFSILLVAIAASKLLLSTSASSHYDADRLHSATHLSLQTIMEAVRSPFAKELLERTVLNYWIVPFLFLAGLLTALQKKAYWHMLVTIGFVALYFIAVCVTFSEFKPFYTESELMPASIILTTPFVYYTLPQLSQKNQVVLLAIIFLLRLIYIGAASQKWVERKDWIMGVLQTMQTQHMSKAIIYENEANNKVLIMNWGTPTESILASALKGEGPQRTFVVDKTENLGNRKPTSNSQMIASFEAVPNESLNHNYFSIDTTANYQVLNLK